jgi:uncharacterized protein YggE
MKLVRIAAIALLALVVGALAGAGRTEAAQGLAAAETQGGITVNGTGAVATTPDIAELGFGVVNQAQTARAALTANAAEARKVVAALRAAGVAAKDIQTQQASLEPRYAEGDRTVAGYTATTFVSAVIRSLDKVAATIDAAVSAGANMLSGPSLTRSNAEQLYRDALKAAVADARAKAGLLADAGDVALGPMTSVVESGIGPVDAKTAERAAIDAPSVEPGTQQITATVTVTFAIG